MVWNQIRAFSACMGSLFSFDIEAGEVKRKFRQQATESQELKQDYTCGQMSWIYVKPHIKNRGALGTCKLSCDITVYCQWSFVMYTQIYSSLSKQKTLRKIHVFDSVKLEPSKNCPKNNFLQFWLFFLPPKFGQKPPLIFLTAHWSIICVL